MAAAARNSWHRGRVHVVEGFDAHPTQVLHLTDAEAAVWLTFTEAGEQ
ncbi:hypothetical protein [Streptomyces sp. NPDC021212]